ncbi:ABC transporter ATP-binding protein [Ramlibacter sp. WS9]|uniref:ABC transporter ATP-binding protein n=1 Tax=Ramlibacter sp. WS9 TaxID=1882741 RepID=UPI0011424556|nr:ABC transporter ATP-binding protein [Ramlibacter sp. WS9]ROZ66080.1 ABC transporter ATP-binding protein [Ramlibacter sp. WS9]
MASISLQGISKSFGETDALSDVRLDIADGEFFVLLGPSGAGKTTTLRVIAGLEQPDTGLVRMNGEDVTTAAPAQRDCAFVFQQYSLYPHLSVFDNLAFPLRAPMRRIAEDEIHRRVERVAATLHIESKLQRKATALSGGEMQRVAIGRALVREPRVYLMDEPLSSLDAKLREELRVELKRIQRQSGATVVYVTHDQVEATTMADRIAILEDGRIQQVGTPEQVYASPVNVQVAQRLGSPPINVLPANWFTGQHTPAAASVGIRPEDVELAGEGEGFECTVVESSLLKHHVICEYAGVEVRARLMQDVAPHPQSRIRLRFPPAQRLLFDQAGQRLAA